MTDCRAQKLTAARRHLPIDTAARAGFDANEHSLTMARDGRDTKERIERAALRLFVEQGIAETSIRQIARKARVSQGAMYNHYASKEALAWHLFSTNFSDFGWELRRRSHEHEGLEAKFKAMIGYVFELFDKDWILVSYVFLARHQHLRKVTPKMGNPYMVFRTVIADAMKRNEIPRQDPDVAASLVVGAILQVTDTKILGRIKQDLSSLSDTVAISCARLLRT